MTTILACAAWPYANGPRHIGHVSGFAVPCDVFARYQRMQGNDVLMVSGTDEHGTAIQVKAPQPPEPAEPALWRGGAPAVRAVARPADAATAGRLSAAS